MKSGLDKSTREPKRCCLLVGWLVYSTAKSYLITTVMQGVPVQCFLCVCNKVETGLGRPDHLISWVTLCPGHFGLDRMIKKNTIR